MDANRPDKEAQSSTEVASIATGASDAVIALQPADRPRRGFTSRQLIVIVAALLIAVLVGRAALREPDLPTFEASGDPIAPPAEGTFPAVSLAEFEGILVGLRGRPVVVNVWASWCAPCRTEMPLFQTAAVTYADEVVILGVASNDESQSAQQFLEDIGVTYPNVFDLTGEIRVALGLTAYPTTYVFGSDGSVRARVDGGVSEQRLAGLIEDALA